VRAHWAHTYYYFLKIIKKSLAHKLYIGIIDKARPKREPKISLKKSSEKNVKKALTQK